MGKKFYCDTCSAALTSKQKLISHIQSHYEPKKKKKKRVQKKKRKDAGAPKKSVLTALIGMDLPYDLEKMMIKRETTINETATLEAC